MNPGDLSGKRVVVTRPPERARSLTELLQARGARVIHLPTIATAPPESWSELDAAIDRLAAGDYDWLLVTSAAGVAALYGRIEQRRPPQAIPDATRFGAVGPVTARALKRRGARVDAMPEEFVGEALGRALGPGPGRVLLPRAAIAPRAIVDVLTEAGWDVDDVAAYRTVAADLEPEVLARVRAGEFDAVTFASPSAVAGFVEKVTPAPDLGLSPGDNPHRIVGCIGPVTAEAAERSGLRVDAVAAEHTAAGLVEALGEAFARRTSRTDRDGTIEA